MNDMMDDSKSITAPQTAANDRPEIFTLYTIGHSSLSLDEFLSHLNAHNIRVLVDVRSAPYSRYVPHYNKANLQAFLLENQVDYRFAGDYLGGRPKDAEAYTDGKIPDEDTKRASFLKLVQYEDVMKSEQYQKGINRLLDIVRETAAQGSNVAIMCSEGNPHECHRHHLIARSLIDPTMKVTDETIEIYHITKDGNIEIVGNTAFAPQLPYQPKLF